MDYPVFAQYQPVLSRFSVQNQHRILRYLAGLAARQYADTTLSAVITALNVLLRHLPGHRQVVLTDDITRTTTQDITDFITVAQLAGLAPTTINTKLSILTDIPALSKISYTTYVGRLSRSPWRAQGVALHATCPARIEAMHDPL